MAIDKTARIHRKAQLAKNVEVGAFTVIGENVRIGDGTRIGNSVTITGHTDIGRQNTIYHNVVLGTPPQDKRYAGMETRLVIGDDNTIREFVTVNIGTGEGGALTVIGHRNYIMACAHVAHDCVLEDDITIANCVMLAGHVKIESKVIMSGGTAVHHFTSIGTMAFVGGLSRVRQDIPPYVMVDGDDVPRGVNRIALERSGMSPEAVAGIEEAFRLVYRSKRPRTQVIEELVARDDLAPQARHFVNFLSNVRQGKRGRYLETVRMPE